MIKFIKKFIELRKERRKNKISSAPMGGISLELKETSSKSDFNSKMLDVSLTQTTDEKDKKKLRQFTKVLVTVLTAMSCLWITYSYVLATIALFTYQNTEVLESLSSQVVISIIGVTASYCLKSFFETWAEKKNELTREMMQYQEPIDDGSICG